MSITNSINVAVILMGIVFIALAMLSGLIKLQAGIVGFINKTKSSHLKDAQMDNSISLNPKTADTASGDLEIIGVDERTAAMIIAIAAYELKIPLNEFQIKSIKALD